jgi:hypothetical protein
MQEVKRLDINESAKEKSGWVSPNFGISRGVLVVSSSKKMPPQTEPALDTAFA